MVEEGETVQFKFCVDLVHYSAALYSSLPRAKLLDSDQTRERRMRAVLISWNVRAGTNYQADRQPVSQPDRQTNRTGVAQIAIYPTHMMGYRWGPDPRILALILITLCAWTNANLVKEFLSAGKEETRSIEPDHVSNFSWSGGNSRPAHPSGTADVGDSFLCEKYGEWSDWSRCNPKCEQTRARICRKPEECGKAWVKEKRTCNRIGGRECKTLSYKVIGQNKRDRMIEDILYDLLYAPWSQWGPCLRSCRQRRRRDCKYRPVCSHSYIQEERRCRVLGSRCERRYSFQPRVTHNISDNSDMSEKNVSSVEASASDDALALAENISIKGNTVGSEGDSEAVAVEKNLSRLGNLFNVAKEDGDRTDSKRGDKRGNVLFMKGRRATKQARRQRRRKRKKNRQRERKSKRRARKGASRRNSCGLRPREISYRVVGGQEVQPHSWPWQVAILTAKNKDHYCGGTLINRYWVLTAAHCVKKRGRPRKFVVRVGEHNIDSGQVDLETTQHDIKPVISIPHPEFDYPTISNDIALIKLKHPPPAFSRAGYACLPPRDFRPANGQLCYIVGWGKTRNTHIYGSERLREAEVPVVRHRKCQRVFDYPISRRQVCAGYKRGGTDSCAGDSGGPLLCSTSREMSHRRYSIYGVTSYGEGCGRKGKYGIYTRVTSYLNWIHETMRKNR
ncbi:plasminogen [Plakobranchus ocellatus]|uniref:Plasminogen n=1 Tax=Plakobranchus ocellatus TaxID=259542 RepID=A0AAV4C2C6_9GAST|nr:plasminogen [Plakobranchus ocellatus]